MTYAGLTISDKPALMDAKERGSEWIARDMNMAIYGYIKEPIKDMFGWYTDYEVDYIGTMETLSFVGVHEKANIDLALAQIAEMERIAGMEEMLKTGDETTKAALFPAYFTAKANEQKPMTWNERINQMTVEEKAEWLRDISECSQCHVIEECNGSCTEMFLKWLASPYTEGEKEDTADEG